MDQKVNINVLKLGMWSTLLYPILLCIGWWLVAGYVPPHLPTFSGEEVATIYQVDAFQIRAGMVITMFGAAMAMPMSMTFAYFISRIEGFFGPISVLQVMGGICMAVLTFYPAMWWLIGTFRPDRSPELTGMLNDAAWLQWVGGLAIYYPQIVSIWIASFIDKSNEPAFPRWFGYFNVWVFLLLLPGQLIFFFKDGPFAWDGLISFWLAFSVFGVWFPVAFWMLKKAIARLENARAQNVVEATAAA